MSVSGRLLLPPQQSVPNVAFPIHRMSSSDSTLRDRYDNMWQNAFPLIQRGEIKIDPVLASNTPDARRGFTLIVRPNADVTARVTNLLQTLKAIEPDQYFYTAQELHVTILTLCTATVDHEQFTTAQTAYAWAAAEALQNASSFEIEFRGVSASPEAIVIQGFPTDATLETIRESVRSTLHRAGLTIGLDTRYRLITAHMTALRFRAPLQNASRFAELLENNRETDFGRIGVNEIQLVKNDWYMSEPTQELLHSYSLRQ